MSRMGEVESIIDKFSGMITRGQAESIMRGCGSGVGPEHILLDNEASATVSELLDLSSKEEIRSAIPSLNVNVRDVVYRVFNDMRTSTAKGATNRRRVAIGSEGRTIIIEMMGRQSDTIDSDKIERGDTITVTNTIFNLYNSTLYTTTRSKVIREGGESGAHMGIDDINPDLNVKNVDVFGEVTGVQDPINTDAGIRGASSSCTLKGALHTAKLYMWGSSAMASKGLSDGDIVKVEFCTVSNTDGQISINAWDSSRILVLKRGR